MIPFSFPAENVTGYYVKIVQRGPVKLVMDGTPADLVMGLGISVVWTVRYRYSGLFCERLMAFWVVKRSMHERLQAAVAT